MAGYRLGIGSGVGTRDSSCFQGRLPSLQAFTLAIQELHQSSRSLMCFFIRCCLLCQIHFFKAPPDSFRQHHCTRDLIRDAAFQRCLADALPVETTRHRRRDSCLHQCKGLATIYLSTTIALCNGPIRLLIFALRGLVTSL